jgi:hypothetical protein
VVRARHVVPFWLGSRRLGSLLSHLVEEGLFDGVERVVLGVLVGQGGCRSRR